MISYRASVVVAALMIAGSADLLAQHTPAIVPGDRVRFWAPSISAFRLEGTVLEIRADTCVLAVEKQASPYALPFASLTRLEISKGMRSHTGKGALYGTAAGAGLGLALGFLVATEEEEVCFSFPGCYETNYGTVAVVTLVFGGLGAATGALIGSRSHEEIWAPLPLDELRVTIVPQRRGALSVGVSLRL